MSKKPDSPLRMGWTTGACATAALKAALHALITGSFLDPVSIRLPKGEAPSFPLAHKELGKGWAKAGIVKDAGDDPDVTHLALIETRVKQGPTGSGLIFKAGPGVGVVTKAGLPIEIGEAAINPAPRAMMRAIVEEFAAHHHIPMDFEIEISVPGGEELAKKTLNSRLGIVGGISILGTTGIVRPFSCSAWIASIHSGIDVLRASGIDHAAACTGQTTETALQQITGLPENCFIDMGDFIGPMLKYLRHHPIAKLSLGGGFGKFTKLAQGHLDLHSGRSTLDFSALSVLVKQNGANKETITAIASANTAMEALSFATASHIDLGNIIAKEAREVASNYVDHRFDIEVFVFDRDGKIVGKADFQSTKKSA